MGLLASQVFALAAAIVAGTSADVARELKIHPFQLSNMSSVARALGNADEQKRKIKKIAAKLADIDANMKLSRADAAWGYVEAGLGQFSN
jgi:hypothetical protein